MKKYGKAPTSGETRNQLSKKFVIKQKRGKAALAISNQVIDVARLGTVMGAAKVREAEKTSDEKQSTPSAVAEAIVRLSRKSISPSALRKGRSVYINANNRTTSSGYRYGERSYNGAPLDIDRVDAPMSKAVTAGPRKRTAIRSK